MDRIFTGTCETTERCRGENVVCRERLQQLPYTEAAFSRNVSAVDKPIGILHRWPSCSPSDDGSSCLEAAAKGSASIGIGAVAMGGAVADLRLP